MTIRQQGGVFGRNPKFNTLDVDNDARIDGNISSQIDAGVEGIHVARNTGSATPTPVEYRIQTKDNAGDWSITDPWGRISFFSQDTSGGGGKIHASVETIAAHPSGGRSKLSLKTSSSSADDLQDALVIDPDQGSGRHVTVSDGNLIIGTSGKGIDFSATSGAGLSELLDDYEEGLWSPTVDIGTCDVQYGSYIKIGKMVHATFSIANLSDTTTASAINVSLPFTAGSFSASEWFGSWIIRRYDVSTSVSGAMRVLGNGTTMDFRYSDTTVGSEPKSVSYADNTSGTNEYLAGSITYFAAS